MLAWAEVHHATVVLDDRGARAEARRGGAAAHGSLWVLAEAITHGRMTEASAAGLVRAVERAVAYYPADAVEDFGSWARSVGLLPRRSSP